MTVRPARNGVFVLLLGLGLGLGALDDASAAGQANPRVLVARVDAAITPVVASYVDDAVERAEGGAYAALVVLLDTPGGLDGSMREIVQRFLVARVPVIVYVSPQGARAASAGALITFAAHVAAMAPGTTIGASTPVDLEGGDVERKVINDAAAFAESIARLRGRDVEFAVATVREGKSAPAEEARSIGAVDLIADSLRGLLQDVDGRQIDVDGRSVTVETADAAVDSHDMGLFRRIQQILADPNLVFLFMSLGTLGLIYELASPGVGVGGVVGAVLILLALFGLAVLPVNAVGLVFLVLAAALFVAELFAPGIGIAAAGGTLLLVLSGIFLVDEAPGLEVSVAAIGPIALVTGGAVVVAGRVAVRSRGTPSTTTGMARFVGRDVTIGRADGPTGQVFLEGAWWRARSTAGEPMEPGWGARVVDVDGLELIVEPLPPKSTHPTSRGESNE